MGALEGTVAIVTGAGSGIGRVTAGRFAGEGARVVAVDLSEAAAAATAADVGGVAVVGSVADEATWDAAVAAAHDLGGVGVVHLNAGLYGATDPIDAVPLDVYRATVAANVDGVVLGTRAVVPAMRAAGGGAIVATASVAGIVPFALNPLYTLTKQAVTGFVVALAPSLAADGISIDCVCPGVVDTPMTERALGGLDPGELGFRPIPPDAIAAEVLDLAVTAAPGSGRTGRCRAILADVPPFDWAPPSWGDLLRAGAPAPESGPPA